MGITLNQFVQENVGKKLDVPGGSPNEDLLGQCVSLVQQYLYQCLDIPYKARGHAKEWVNLPSDIAVKVTDGPKSGDMIVWPTRGEGYGHIAVAISATEIFEQNAYPEYVAQRLSFAKAQQRSNYEAYVIMRPTKLIEVGEPSTTGVYLNATRQPFRVRTSPVSGTVNHIVEVGGRAEVTGFLGIESDGYQWLRVKSRNFDGYAQLDTYNCYTLSGYASGRYLVATKQKFRIRDYPVTGKELAMINIGERVMITEFLPIQSDGYQWVKVNHSIYGQGFAQIDTHNCYTVM